MAHPSKRLLLFTAKLGYQTSSFEDAAHKLGVQLVYVTDRCHQLEDPWGDQAIAVHFETPEVAAYAVMEALRGQEPRMNIHRKAGVRLGISAIVQSDIVRGEADQDIVPSARLLPPLA